MTINPAHAPTITREHIANAIVQLMRGSNGDGRVDMALAGTIAGQVLPDVIKQFAGIDPSQLATQSSFRSMLQLHIAAPSAADERSTANILRTANVTSADYANAERLRDGAGGAAAHGRFQAFVTGGHVEGRPMPDLSHVNGNMTMAEAQNIAGARAEASRLGMGWALNNPELLKLGAGAIKTLHEAGVQKERFERMTGDKVGFRAATAVEIAAYAKRHNLTPEQTNALYDKINNGVEIISGGNKGIQRELDEATRRYITTPDSPESRRALEDSFARHADTPTKKKGADGATQALIEARQQNGAAAVVTNASVDARNESGVRAAAVEARVTEKANDLDASLGVPVDAAKPAAVTQPAPAPTKVTAHKL